jgi:hypothetical protein
MLKAHVFSGFIHIYKINTESAHEIHNDQTNKETNNKCSGRQSVPNTREEK